jgi:EAL domain-containing protein (putative c-di-GMP-specific phosphodiesterase class I)/GGDEF domain-containing protein
VLNFGIFRLVTSLSNNQARQSLGYLVFAIVALASFVFWGFELRLSMTSHDEHAEEVLASYQLRQLELKSEAIRDVIQEMYQTARTISLLPSIRTVQGANRRSIKEDVVRQGRLSPDTDRMLRQVYANLNSYVRISEVYYILDGFDPDHGDIPFFMYDEMIARHPTDSSPGHSLKSETDDETHEYAEIKRQLAWFKKNAPDFRYETELNGIPALISPLLKTCDNTQTIPGKPDSQQEATGFIYSIPVYDTPNKKFKGIISIIIKANVLEAKLIGVPFLPITAAEQSAMQAAGWKMPPPSHYILSEKNQGIEITDRRNSIFVEGLDAARSNPQLGGRWASHTLDMPVNGKWELHHHMMEPEIEALVGGIRFSKRASVAGRIFLVLALTGFLGWGFWLMRASRQELIRMAHYDQLTNLPNRHLFFDRMENGMARAKRNKTKLGLFFVDLSDLNAINDRHGHQGGDLLLIKLADRLREQLRETDSIVSGLPGQSSGKAAALLDSINFTLSRLGGDEFTILCEGLNSTDDLVTVAERILDCVKAPFPLGHEMVDLSLNIGAAVFPDDADDPERLLMHADHAMHECKHTNGHYVLFNEGMRKRADRLHQLTTELNTALQKGQFELFYQPKAHIRDNRIVSMEALIRWHHPNLGMISPLEFIPILERNGAIVAVGEWIVEQACRDLHRLEAAGFGELQLSVNVSVRQLKQSQFIDFLKRAIIEQKINAHQLILEITETMVMEDLQKGRETLLALKDLGFQLAIDDFGAGYSSLTYLQHLPIDYLKIDKSLIDGMLDDRSTHVVESVIRLAHGLSLKTVAEGIETEDQLTLIAQLGCDIIQGYLLSRPQPMVKILEWLKQRQTEVAEIKSV